MFSFKSRDRKNLLKDVHNVLHNAWKVYHYRRDVIDAALLEKLEKAAEKLQEALADKNADDKQLALDKDELEAILKKCGGRMYPITFLSENVEVILVAAILAIGIRSFFFQPFKIPTNSMWPTYAGINSVAYESPDDAPSGIGKVIRKIRYCATSYQMRAPADGELIIPMKAVRGDVGTYYVLEMEEFNKKQAFIFNVETARYAFYIGADKVTIDVPLVYDMGGLIQQTLAPGLDTFSDYYRRVQKTLKDGTMWLATGRHFKKGDMIFGFEMQTGDMLFVNRFSYNFWPPEVGDPFVFRTDIIRNITDDKYYIKRLVGEAGDELHVSSRKLYRNDEPITGAPAFAKNNAQEAPYRGYRALSPYLGFVDDGKIAYLNKVPDKHYVAMGDNSLNSADSRQWGYVPERSVVGKAAFVFYPFGERWGFAK